MDFRLAESGPRAVDASAAGRRAGRIETTQLLIAILSLPTPHLASQRHRGRYQFSERISGAEKPGLENDGPNSSAGKTTGPDKKPSYFPSVEKATPREKKHVRIFISL